MICIDFHRIFINFHELFIDFHWILGPSIGLSGKSLEAPWDPLGPEVAIGLPSGQLELGGASSIVNNNKRRCEHAFRLDETSAGVTKYRACAQKHANVNPGSGPGHGPAPPTGPIETPPETLQRNAVWVMN